MFQKQEYLGNLARCKLYYLLYLTNGILGSFSFTSNLVIIEGKAEIGWGRSSFCRSFANGEITGPYQYLPKIIQNVDFLK